MYKQVETPKTNKHHSVAEAVSQTQSNGGAFQFVDNRPEATSQQKLQELANSSPQAKHSAQFLIEMRMELRANSSFGLNEWRLPTG